MNLLPFIWAIAGLLMIVSEFVITDFVMFFFGLGALLTGVLTFFVPGIADSLLLQFLLWGGFSGLSLLTLRRYFGRTFRGKRFDSKAQDHLVGRNARVVEEILPNSPGRISCDGTTWKAVSYDEHFSSGEKVTIIQQEGIGYVVTRQLLEDAPADPE